ncbi:hypothetical protein LTR99_011179 [Exophiala xenobiotica]|uniref:Uncharacterized protein n=1 Tax=Vermiconidia calcicola TaxID=1690605 RepID=A0AAV9PSI9_9PEZI|nr:hypothetical protein H2202_010975 [Exophiala xenobiotica]KAK5527473.1 hypothetical protein LTR25_011170 [Vermiconidia calcicola]KAK5528157.1 hypothetical protein LTR23_011119 [Chaetothyriales sp. CCFEE 6169]KAK5290108.1 hypothetical protein LTR99_011179 [Exophiala xenobiotica]KAK5311017.1 hypothetical protein LTR93_011860 [Exophiala xenobiotica]
MSDSRSDPKGNAEGKAGETSAGKQEDSQAAQDAQDAISRAKRIETQRGKHQERRNEMKKWKVDKKDQHDRKKKQQESLQQQLEQLLKQDESESRRTEEQKINKDIDMIDTDLKAMENDSENFMDFEYGDANIPRPSIEASTEDDDQDSDPAAIPFQAGSDTSELFPGAPCVTVAKKCMRGNRDESPTYLNRYGPRKCGWFVFSTTLLLPDGAEEKDLVNVSEKMDRILDYPRRQGEPKPRLGDVQGFLNIVWDYGKLEGDPLEAAELLNPRKVKQTDKYPTEKERRHNKLDKYPQVKIQLQFKKNWKTDSVEKATSWELGSAFRQLYRKEQIKAEDEVYRMALKQAERFLHWYQSIKPDDFDEKGVYKRSPSREPTTVPLNRTRTTTTSVSPTPPPETTQAPKPGQTQLPTPPPDEKTPTPPPDGKVGNKPQIDQDSTKGKKKMTRERFEKIILKAYKDAENITGEMTEDQNDEWEVYFDAYASRKGYPPK